MLNLVTDHAPVGNFLTLLALQYIMVLLLLLSCKILWSITHHGKSVFLDPELTLLVFRMYKCHIRKDMNT
jgi:hypothetical protein